MCNVFPLSRKRELRWMIMACGLSLVVSARFPEEGTAVRITTAHAMLVIALSDAVRRLQHVSTLARLYISAIYCYRLVQNEVTVREQIWWLDFHRSAEP